MQKKWKAKRIKLIIVKALNSVKKLLMLQIKIINSRNNHWATNQILSTVCKQTKKANKVQFVFKNITKYLKWRKSQECVFYQRKAMI